MTWGAAGRASGISLLDIRLKETGHESVLAGTGCNTGFARKPITRLVASPAGCGDGYGPP